ncbi:MAG: DUF3168 domain-containing protein [Sphingobium sp.]|jgi:hypothetical protein|nr:DUF3168 domain-containing protein [Sphingobium sp.]MCP5398312.1 DUF3168 domain-containing protein [Sphingomonas sp.]
MNAEYDIRGALIAELRGDVALTAQVNRIHDGVPDKATPPTMMVGECLGTDWAVKDKPGRELRIAITIEDDIETPTRISGIMPVTDAAVQRLTGTVAGWQVGSLRMVRSRLLRTNAGRWNALMDYRIRVLAV